jgi:hypothetical protein
MVIKTKNSKLEFKFYKFYCVDFTFIMKKKSDYRLKICHKKRPFKMKDLLNKLYLKIL